MNDKAAQIISPRDMDLIRNYLVGGAALGGGTALVTSLANHLKTLKRESANTSDDDDTLYINVPGQPGSQVVPGAKQASLGGGLAIAGGALAGLGSYALVRTMYQNIKRKRLQAELDKAQNAYVGAVDTDAKSASDGKSMGLTELLTSAPIAIPILLGLGSGALANKFLDQNFPGRRKRQSVGPRRVVLRSAPPAPASPVADPMEQPEEMKSASDDTSGAEFLVQLVLGNYKQASLGDLSNLVASAASGHCADLELAFAENAELALDLVKGASELPVNLPMHVIATSFLCKSAMIAPTVQLLAAAEFAEMAPTFFKMASELDEDTSEALVGIMNELGTALRHDALCEYIRQPDMSKYASLSPKDRGGDLAQFLDKANDVPETTMDSSSSEDNRDPDHKHNKPIVTPIGATAQKFQKDNKDLIDQVLSPEAETPLPR